MAGRQEVQNKKRESVYLGSGKKEDSKSLLLKSAKELFAQKGYEGVVVREIAERADVNFSLIRYYFNDKEGIYRACLEEYGKARLSSALKNIEPVQNSEEFKARFKIMIYEIVDSLMLDTDLSKIMLREMESEDPVAPDIIKNTIVKMAEAFISFFKSAQEVGVLRQDISPIFMTQILQLTLSHMVLTDSARSRYFNKSIKKSINKNEMVNSFFNLFLTGVLSYGK